MADRRSGEVVIDASWRARAHSLQEEALPSGRVVVSCPAPLGVGGLGRHLEEIVAALDRRGEPHEFISKAAVDSGSQDPSRRPYSRALTTALAIPTRFSPALRMWKGSAGFDRDTARRLPRADHLIAFNGTALSQFRAGRRAGMESISLMSANSHMRRVIRQHDRAYRQYPVERPWATRLLKRNLAEYAAAQRIYVASSYIWESFLEEGYPAELLSLFPLTPHPRYESAGAHARSDTFDIAYVGSLTVHKGVPLLIDAFRRLRHADMRLVLVGGWKTPSMRRFIEGACAEDGRISVRPGDPLPHLRRARLCVHPAYEDGFAYAPAEALACGVPVIVSEDTGMKDLISTDRHGVVLPTGDLGALTEAIEAAYRGEILGG